MTNNIPVIIFHLGKQPYVKQCLHSGIKYGNEMVIINETSNMFPDLNVTCVPMAKYTEKVSEFNGLFKNFSTNPEKFEALCVIRWIIVHEYMVKHNIERAFLCDSDVLLYDNITEFDNKHLKQYDYALCSTHTNNVTGGQSIWNRDVLGKFVDFIFEFYKTQKHAMENWYKTYKQDGGICDMTLLYYFCHNEKKFQGLRLPNLPYFTKDMTQVFNNEVTCDLHIASPGNQLHPDDYTMIKFPNGHSIKKLEFKNGQPYCLNKRLNKRIRFILIHFTGINKQFIDQYYKKTIQ